MPIDFIAVLTSEHPFASLPPKLLANCFAQSEALKLGRTLARKHVKWTAPTSRNWRRTRCLGNRPTSTLLVDALTARSLGALIALYEHKVLVQASVWNINPFDQWSVESGKILGKVVSGVQGEEQGKLPSALPVRRGSLCSSPVKRTINYSGDVPRSHSTRTGATDIR
ncbi:hypothetical protein [Paraburkholderia hospita]|uniref:hypothetical protein n=1 Tax=Paraburkholderia hospita TaxID=169430 RepID=UPI0026867A89